MHKIKALRQDLSFLYRSFKLPILGNRKYFIIGVFLVLCSGLSQASLPYLIGRLVDVLSGKEIGGSILFRCGRHFSRSCFRILFQVIRRIYFMALAEITTFVFMLLLFSRLKRYPRIFFCNGQVGSLLSWFTIDFQCLKRCF